jgi:phage repressor protein C with HTH and peptisase S24 domain
MMQVELRSTNPFMWEVNRANLAKAMEAAGLNQSELAERVGMKQPSIGRLLTGETRTTRALDLIAQALGTSPAYLRGDTDDPSPRIHPLHMAMRSSASESADSTVMIPQLDIGYSMGGGSVFEDYAQTALIPFPREWLRPMIGGTFGEIFVARGEGDSMMPTILDGDVVIVDTAQKTITKQDRLWCLSYGELGMIKRVRMQPDGGALIISDNPAVENFTAYDGEVSTIGRVIWIGRRV